MATVNLFGALALDTTLQAVRDYISSLIGRRDAVAAADQIGIAALAIRGDADTIPGADGDLVMFRMDEEGRLKVATKPASFPVISGAVNAVAGQLAADVTRASNIVFHVKNTGSATIAAGTFIFEASVDSTNGTDGTWFGIQAIRSNANTIETSIALSGITAGTGNAWSYEASVNAYNWVRIRCSVAVTASASAQWTIIRGSYATEPIPGGQATATQTVSGTVVVSSITAGAVVNSPTTGGLSYVAVTTASTNAALIKTGGTALQLLVVSNPTATAAYVKLYNKATTPTVGTDIPAETYAVAAGQTLAVQFGSIGNKFALGCGIAVTAAAAATDTGVAVAGVQIHGTYL